MSFIKFLSSSTINFYLALLTRNRLDFSFILNNCLLTIKNFITITSYFE